jgi:hypothetical protein
MISHTIPINIPSLTNSLLILLRYRTVKSTTVDVKTTGIIDSNNGRLEDLKGKMKKETAKGINQIRKPKNIIVFQFLLDINLNF